MSSEKKITVDMVQTGKHSWAIVACKSGAVLQSGITAFSVESAEEHIRRYVSSFSDWTYEIKPKVKK